MSETLLRVDKLSVAFGYPGQRQRVVDEISFDVKAGEKVALVGESGSGKSVTALSLLRLHDPLQSEYPTGSIQFAGKELMGLSDRAMRGVRGRDIAMIFQEPMTSLNPVQTIGEQLIEPLRIHEGLDREPARQRMLQLLERVGIPEPQKRMDAFPHMLSGGQRQRIMIAMALACRPKLLIADEPTTALDVTIQKQILLLLDELQEEFNMAVLLITHDLHLVRRFAHRVCVMQDGKLVERGDTEALFSAPQHAYTQKLLASEPERLIESEEGLERAVPLMQGEAIKCHFPIKAAGFIRRTVGYVKAVDDIGLTLYPGETIGIVGESGSGKSTLGMCLLKLQSCEGAIRFQNHDLQALSSKQIRPLRRHFQVVFQDPYSSLSPRMTIAGIIGEGLQLHFPQLNKAERRQRMEQVMKEVGLDPSMLERYPHEFSGGQRQRIAIARAVVLEPEILLLDEPTSALDVSVQKQVLILLRQLQKRHKMSFLFISHDLRVVRSIAHRVLVMRDGKIVESGETETVFGQPQHDYTKTLLDAALLTAS